MFSTNFEGQVYVQKITYSSILSKVGLHILMNVIISLYLRKSLRCTKCDHFKSLHLGNSCSFVNKILVNGQNHLCGCKYDP